MSNHFPTVPGSFNLVSVTYTAYWNVSAGNFENVALYTPAGIEPDPIAGGMYGAGTSDVAGEGFQNEIAVIPFVFSTPGSAGSFDQDTAEGDIASVLDDITAGTAAVLGQTTATIKSRVSVAREWLWQDSTSQFTLTYRDSMAY